MDFLDFLMDFGVRKVRKLKPLYARALDLGITVYSEISGKRDEISDIIRDVKKNRKPVEKILRANKMEKGGCFIVCFADHDIFRVELSDTGRNRVHLVFMEGKAKEFFGPLGEEISQMRSAFMESFDDDDVQDLMEITADFLTDRQGEVFSYEILAGGTPFIEGVLEDQDLNVQMVDPVIYLKSLLFLIEGRNFINIKLSSPMDMYRLMERIQDAIRDMAVCYQFAGLRLNAGLMGETVFRAGRDVKPNFTSAFGPTNIKLDSTFRIMSSILSKINL